MFSPGESETKRINYKSPEETGVSDSEQEKKSMRRYLSDSQTIASHSPLMVQGMNVISSDIIEQREEHDKVWGPILHSKEWQVMENEYHKISPKNLVYFDVLDKKTFTSETKKNLEEIYLENNNLGLRPRWNEAEIDRMFGKGLNPTSLITSLESVEWFEGEIEGNCSSSISVLELGSGAGWATVMLYKTLEEKNQGKKVNIFSVDSSVHAVAATKTLLNYYNIPYIVCTSEERLTEAEDWLEKTDQGQSFSGVILILSEFNDVVKSFKEDTFSGIYSSHGTAYLSRNEYSSLLKESERILRNSGVFIADSLNPLYTNRLDKLLTFSQILNPDAVKNRLDGKGIEYIYSKKELKNNSKYFTSENVKILKGFNTPHAYLIIKWCNYLLRRLDFRRLLRTIKSLSVTMKVVDEYRSDVFPSFLLKEIMEEEKLPFSLIEGGRPNFPIFMDTQGFKLSK